MTDTDSTIRFDAACTLLETILEGSLRREIVEGLMKEKSQAGALARLRSSLRANTFKAAASTLTLDRTIRGLDNRTREDGFHVLHDWDGKASKLNPDIIPIDVLNYFAGTVEKAPPAAAPLAILLDYYFAYVLALLALRVWDENDPGVALDRVSKLVAKLQGPAGSGQAFAVDAESLIFIATSHFEPDDSAYDRLLQRVMSLDESHRLRVALVHAAILGSHLRFGFDAQYARDLSNMRSDNAPDYLWLCFSVITLMRAYAKMHDNTSAGAERSRVVEGLLNALTPDVRAFVGKAPESLAKMESECAEFHDLFLKYKSDLLVEFEEQRPLSDTYSPLCFNFNFPHNLLKAMVADALFHRPSAVSFNDLLTSHIRDEDAAENRKALVERLLGYARSSPDTIRGRPMPIITYDPYGGIRVFTRTMGILRDVQEV